MNFSDKQILFVDFESFYDTKAKYGLRELSMTEYIRDPRFKAHGLAYQWMQEGKTHWISGDHTISGWVFSIDWSKTVVISHNAKFDGAILAWKWGVKPYAWYDTVALAKATLGENVSGYGLASLAQYLGLQPKGDLKWDGAYRSEWTHDDAWREAIGGCDGIPSHMKVMTVQDESDMAEYCRGDVDICRGIYDKLAGQFPQSQLAAMDWTIRAFIEPRLVLDIATLEKGVKDEKARREEAIKASGVDKKVLASNKQFAEHLAAQGIAVPTKMSGRTGKAIPAFARADEGLESVRRANPCLYAARIASKANLLETRGESLLRVGRTGAFPFDVGFSGAVQTHRYSGSSGAGGNPQNFTRKSFLREAICAPTGHSLVVGDFSAVELRILAWLAKEPRLINKLVNDEDVYADFASAFYGKPVPPKEPTPERHFGKCAILGLGYGMGGAKFQATVKAQLKQDITEGAAYGAVKFYRSTYFNVPKLWEACSSLIPLIAEGRIGCLYFAPFLKVRKGAIVLPSGLSIQYPNLRRVGDEWVYDVFHKKYEAEPTKLYGGKLVENICQGLAGELCKEAIQRAIGSGLDCVGAVHDEILVVSKDAVADTTNLRHCMEQSPAWWPQIKLRAELGAGSNWNNAKK